MRYRSITNVIAEIKLLYDSYGVRELHIEDNNFTLNKEYVVNFCQAMIDLKLNLALALPNGVRLDTLDEAVVKLMARAGFYAMAVGIESGNDRILKLMKKKLSTDLIREKIKLIKKHTKINLTGLFLIGYRQNRIGNIGHHRLRQVVSDR